MTGVLTTLGSSLPAGAAISVFLGTNLVWLACRLISIIELRMILRSLPRVDRATAALAYITASRSRHPLLAGRRQPCARPETRQGRL